MGEGGLWTIRPRLQWPVLSSIAGWPTEMRFYKACLQLVHVEPGQRLQDCLARVVTGAYHGDHIKPVFKELYWLSIRARNNFKITTPIHKVKTSHQPSYLADLINDNRPARTLRSLSMTILGERPVRISTGSRCFHYSDAKTLNKLPETVR